MWDMFGPYDESVATNALDKSLAADPDVAFLVNHKGVTMARTTNGSLLLKSDLTGLGTQAFLNAERQDVRDFVSAVMDEDVDEMSFAFMINQGEWDEDFENFRLTELDINRGDVSGVNYGANPFTSISARAAECSRPRRLCQRLWWLKMMRRGASELTEFGDAAAELGNRARERYVRAAEERSAVLAPAPVAPVEVPVREGKSFTTGLLT